MEEKETWTSLKLLKWTTDYFAKHGVEEPRLDAEILLARTLGIERIMLYAGFERVIAGDELARFREQVKERAAGRPAKYITGRTEFYSLPFLVDERVLIPRPETELLVERALALLKAAPPETRPVVVEVGTGSGAIIVATAANHAGARYVATDISDEALDVARANAEMSGVTAAIEFHGGDLFEPLDRLALAGHVDILISNPPYVSEDGYARLPRDIRAYEPRVALVAGPRGTEVHERILDRAHVYLKPGGTLLMEMDNDQKPRLEEYAAKSGRYQAALFHQDYARLWRVIEIMRR